VKPLVKGADLLTALRLPLAAAFPFVSSPVGRLAIIAAAAVSDMLDGWLARRYGGSRLGAVLDPVVDKIFMVVAFLTVSQQGLLTWWEMVGVLARDITAVVAAITVWLQGRPTALPARAGGKAVTILQMATLTACILQSEWVRPLAWATAAVAVYAIWDYARADARARRASHGGT
jgi:phosphatidylglycerophosphate synthase